MPEHILTDMAAITHDDLGQTNLHLWARVQQFFLVCFTSTWPVNTFIGGSCGDVGSVDAEEEDVELAKALLLGSTDDGGRGGGGGGEVVSLWRLGLY